MKQLLQNIRNGEATITEVPAPWLSARQVLVQAAASLVSVGTERMVVDFADKNLLAKARARPDLVRQTIDKAKREGALSTLHAVQNRLSQPMALGYSSSGNVIEIGGDVTGIREGDRVACAGGGFAVHAEYVAIPTNLLVKLPEEVDSESAAFTTLGAIALQGVRLADVRVGEVVAVIGLGLLGQLTVQILKAAGCLVVGMDPRFDRAKLADRLGADDTSTSDDELISITENLTDGHGADSVVITADTSSNQPVEVAGAISRKKGVIVAVGAVGMSIPRKIYYEKELDFRISSSYGPGRYDRSYEEDGVDYPYAYVRWTENRNMQAFVQMLAGGTVDVQPLITHRFPIDRATEAYDLITGKSGSDYLGVLLTYPEGQNKVLADERKIILSNPKVTEREETDKLRREVGLGVIGAGNYANATFLPIIKKISDINLVGIADISGSSGRVTGDRHGFDYCTSDLLEILKDEQISTVAILTRHNQHAGQVIKALEARKHVFVEKPLCLNQKELEEIIDAYNTVNDQPESCKIMVGYNRRFAPFIRELKQHLVKIHEPLILNFRVNAGYIPPDHWTQDIKKGGGRLLGEGCHFIDLLIFLAGDQPKRVRTTVLPDSGRYRQDNFIVSLEFANGSVGTVTYAANGNKAYGKEFLEVFGGGLSARMDDYRTLVIYNGKKSLKRKARLRQDKGHLAEWQALTAWLMDQGPVPMTFSEIVMSTGVTLAAEQSRKQFTEIKLDLG